ncbi:MAG: stalk-specific protein X [Phenylobacterium sp.]|nr:stalk-specific protein X [Phenylobacterium sp.]
MAITITKLMLRCATTAALLALAACSGPSSHEVAPPPDAYTQAPPPELMGGAPGARYDSSGLAGGPSGGQAAQGSAYREPPRNVNRLVTYRRADGVLVTAMRPVPNPEDMSARERRLVYGNRYAPRAYVSAPPRVRRPASQAYYAPAKPVARPAVAAPRPAVVAAKPLAPKPLAPAAKPVVAAAPKVIEQAKPAEAPKPAPVLAKTPQPTFPATGLPAPADPKLAKLQTAVGGEVASSSKLTVPDAVTKGEAGQVSLGLPQTLLATLQREAAKLGLTKAAKNGEVTATLSGTGYEITPNGPQTAKLKTGDAAAFNWQVKPGAGERGPLKADVDAGLTGVKPPMTFSLASIEQALAAVMPQAPAKKQGFSFQGLLSKLTIPGMKDVSVPGVGSVPSNKVVAGALVLAALALLIALARGAGESRRRAERRRKFRTMTDYGATSHQEPDDHHHGVAAPLAAAAAGAAAAGAVAAHHHDESHGDSHGHDAHGAHDTHAAHDDHAAHDAHGHADNHGHDSHAADDHGHGAHDDHAAHDAHGHAEAHDSHGHGAHAAHDDHGHAAHDDHAGAHAVAHDDHGHAPAQGHDDHGHGAAHGHDAHHKQPEHAH